MPNNWQQRYQMVADECQVLARRRDEQDGIIKRLDSTCLMYEEDIEKLHRNRRIERLVILLVALAGALVEQWLRNG